MMEIWNVKDLQPPPVCTCKVSTKNIDVDLLVLSLKNAIDFFQNQHQLSTEAALLSRCVYRLKTKFRTSKDLKAAEKLSRALRLYLQLQITIPLKTLWQSIPRTRPNKTFMPAKNMLDYVLVRLQGLGKLMLRVVETSKITALWLQQKLRIGHFWKLSTIVTALSARIFVIARNILKFSCSLYGNLLAFDSQLANQGRVWLPEGYKFPERLDKWLDVDMDADDEVIEILDEATGASFFNLVDSDDEVEFCEEYILIRDESLRSSPTLVEDEEGVIEIEDSKKLEEEKGCMLLEKDEVDVGEVIQIEDSVIGKKRKKRKQEDNQEVIEILDETIPYQTKRRKNKKTKNEAQNRNMLNARKPKVKRYFDQNLQPAKKRKRKSSIALPTVQKSKRRKRKKPKQTLNSIPVI